MEVAAYVGIVISSFIFGIALGATLENRRLTILKRLVALEQVTQEMFAPSEEGHACDMCEDLKTTMKIPKIERGTHAEES